MTEEIVKLVLRERISPLLRSHGGDLSLSQIKDKTVFVRFSGACRFCPAAHETVEKIVQAMIREYFKDDNIDVILENSVSDDLLEQAKNILRKPK
ncbi:NifU family protein [Porphyromonas gingivalis]|uniref:NifU family protein n=1 Tax=Porphyromonas gingivalis TaxID=837 RepID=UPI001B8BC963|nr:NifU family protein [Porphyromonas gingivalis]MDP0531309.1 NifU family protein [Porphyromonas gingivalis]MDP0624906.1 NifU family protein [Porphyromonas gingivalis]QUI90256.1 NifU family protein [Porphyromonas gingivalis]QUI92201.1 NifU family protein [Porphyromonas gingivalis]WKD51964.1 NifU family protein [Porphyromonas gingivalis]